MSATSLRSPQSFNLYAYAQNSVIDFIDPSGLCTFKIILKIGNNPHTFYSNTDVIKGAQNEITRIVNAAGHNVTFDENAKADATGTWTMTRGRYSQVPTARGTTRNSTKEGEIWVDRLFSLGVESTPRVWTGEGLALTLGRVLAHEAFTHAFLQLTNAQHTATGLTKGTFDGKSLSSASASNEYGISKEQADKLNDYCKKDNNFNNPKIGPPFYGGGGGGENPGYRLYDNGWSGLDWLWWSYNQQQEQERRRRLL